MKYLIYSIILFLPLLAPAQNLVIDGSFENYNNCPIHISNVTDDCSNWNNFNVSTTADYFHTCGTGNAGIPTGSGGYQLPAHGNGQIGIIAYMPNYAWKETIRGRMMPMTIGETYQVSVSVNLGNISHYMSDNVDVYFYQYGDSTRADNDVNAIVPQVKFTSYGSISDTQNWVRIIDTFTADSAYNNIVIGGFNHNPSYTSFAPQGNAAYYYLDSLVVRPIKGLNVKDSILCVADTILLDYTYLIFQPNSTFTLQLSDKNGDFSTPIPIGSIPAQSTGTITGVLPDNLSNGVGYKVRVVTSNPADTILSPSTLKIGNPDSANITTTQNSPLCAGKDLVLYAGTNITPTTYSWTGPNGFSSTQAYSTIYSALPVHTGDYYAGIKFYGCEVADTVSVLIKPLPAAPAATSNTGLCAGDTLKLLASSSGGATSFSWAGPGSFSSTEQKPVIPGSTTAMNGDYIVTATLNGCIAKDTTSVTVKQPPAAVSLSSNSPVCTYDTLVLNSTGSNSGATYSWTGPNSFTATTQNASINNPSVTATGWYKMLVDYNGCDYADSVYATVNAAPATPVLSYNSPLCQGETLNLTINNIPGGIYSWTGPNSFNSNMQSPTRANMQYGDTGKYDITATVNGCTSAADISVHINPNPFVVILASPSDTICAGDPVVFNAYPNNHGGTPTFEWYVNNQLTSTGTNYSTSGLSNNTTIRCKMTEYTKCSAVYHDESNDITMKVLPWMAPSVNIISDPAGPLKPDEYVKFTATPTNAGNNPGYQWRQNGSDVVGATGKTWSANTLNDNDRVSVEVISNYRCPQPATSISNVIDVRVLTGLSNLPGDNDIMLYPNPNNGMFVLKGNITTNEVITIRITNTVGQNVYTKQVQPVNNKLDTTINADYLASGIYNLLLKTNEGQKVFRFTVR